MSNRRIWLLGILAVVSATALGVGLATAAGSSGGPIVKTPGEATFKINQYAKESHRFAPGTVTVASGGTVTFENTSKDEPHTATIGTKAQMPRSFEQRCAPCEQAAGHLKNPKDENSPVKTYVLNKGQPGFDMPGDSVLIAPKGPHKTAKVVISAPAGTVLYYVCAIHPWMQGRIIVK